MQKSDPPFSPEFTIFYPQGVWISLFFHIPPFLPEFVHILSHTTFSLIFNGFDLFSTFRPPYYEND